MRGSRRFVRMRWRVFVRARGSRSLSVLGCFGRAVIWRKVFRRRWMRLLDGVVVG